MWIREKLTPRRRRWQDRPVTHRHFIGALAALGLLAPAAALAQENQTTPPPAEAPKPPASATSIVVFSDAVADETENAKLRAKVYEAARERGFVPDPKADVAAAAQAKGAISEGRVSSDETALEGVRAALGVAVLVRIAMDGNAIKIVVAHDGGVKSKTVATPDAVPGAVTELLGGKAKASALGPTAAAPPPASSSASDAASTESHASLSAGLILRPKKDDQPDLTDPKALRAAWDKRGGLRASYGVHAVLTGLLVEDTPFVGQNPESGQLELGKADTYGVGAGLGLDLSMMYLPVPQPASGSTSWAAFRLGVRLDVSGLYVRPPEKYSYKTTNGQVTARDEKFDNVAYVYGVLPLQAGVHFGLGDFRLPTLWRGLALGLAYSPAWIFSLKIGEKENATDSRFNYAGFELSIDTVKIEAESGSQPQLRLSALVLPKVKDDLPWLASAGIGAIWY